MHGILACAHTLRSCLECFCVVDVGQADGTEGDEVVDVGFALVEQLVRSLVRVGTPSVQGSVHQIHCCLRCIAPKFLAHASVMQHCSGLHVDSLDASLR